MWLGKSEEGKLTGGEKTGDGIREGEREHTEELQHHHHY